MPGFGVSPRPGHLKDTWLCSITTGGLPLKESLGLPTSQGYRRLVKSTSPPYSKKIVHYTLNLPHLLSFPPNPPDCTLHRPNLVGTTPNRARCLTSLEAASCSPRTQKSKSRMSASDCVSATPAKTESLMQTRCATFVTPFWISAWTTRGIPLRLPSCLKVSVSAPAAPACTDPPP
jgi:hypothetical protein